MVKRFLVGLVGALAVLAVPVSSQVVITPAPIPSVSVGCVIQVQSISPTVWICGAAGSGTVTVTGTRTAGVLTKFNSDGVITNSIASESGSTITVAGTLNATTLQVGGCSINTAGCLGNVVYVSTAPTLTGTNFTAIPAASIVAGTFGSGSYVITGGLIVGSVGSGPLLTVGHVTDSSISPEMRFRAGSGQRAWQVGANLTVGGAFEISPSTSNGGTTFGTPVFFMTPSGDGVFGGVSTGDFTIGGTVIDGNARFVVYTENTSKPAASLYSNVALTEPLVQIWQDGAAATGQALLIFNDGDGNSLQIVNDGVSQFAVSPTGALRMAAYGAGTLVTDGSGNVTASSDERLKNITGQFRVGLNAIMGLRPILHTWKPETGYDTENVYASWSAQNVLQFVPEAVGVGLNGMYTVNDRPVLLALVNAVQELTAEVDALRAAAKLPAVARGMAPIVGDARAVKSATTARLAEVAKEAAGRKVDEARKAEQVVKDRISACEADNAIIVKQGGKALACATTAEEKAVQSIMREAEKAAEAKRADDAKKAAAACQSRNALIVKQGGKPVACEAVR